VSIILQNKYLLIVFVSTMVLFLGIYYCNTFRLRNLSKTLPYDQDLSFEAVVDDYPDERENNVKYTLKILKSDHEILKDQHILMTLPQYPKYVYSDILSVSGQLEKPQNFHGFNYEMYLARYNIFSIVKYSQYSKTNPSVQKVGFDDSNKFYNLMYFIREKIRGNFSKIFPEPELGMVSAIVLGLKRAISSDVMEKLRIVGISHIVVISGFHISVIVKIFQSIFATLGKKTVFVLGTFVLIGFIVLTGASLSVIRASVMAWLFLLAPILGRRGHITNLLFLTIVVMILQNPLIIAYDIGFQLSVLSVLGLIYLMPIFDKIFSKLGDIVGTAVSATLSAQIMTLPVVLHSFSRFSVVAPIANIVITPIVPIIIVYAITIAIASFINMQISFIISWPLLFMLRYIISVTDFFSQLSFASIELQFKSYYVILYFIILTLCLLIISKYDNKSTSK
jgi:competence protein ComEC